MLDKGDSGLVVVAATDEAARVEDSFSSAAKVMRKDLKANKSQLRADLERAAELERATAD